MMSITFNMKKPEYILDKEKKSSLIFSQIIFKSEEQIKKIYSIIKLEPSFSKEEIDDDFVIIPRENIYTTVHGFYLVFGFSYLDGTPNALSIFYNQSQNKELKFYINQLKTQIKNATVNNRGIERQN